MTSTANSEIVAVIPARGGSTGLPEKNIRTLTGKPRIACSIESAFVAQEITRMVVSTYDAKIAEVARKCGADVVALATTFSIAAVLIQRPAANWSAKRKSRAHSGSKLKINL